MTAADSPVSVSRKGEVAVVTVDNPPVNALSRAVRAGLLAAVEQTARDGEVRAVVLACAGRTFIAGADVREFGLPPEAPHLPDVLAAIERAGKPWVAALHGTALGGGFETALACHYRIASPDAAVGLPEVTLGVVPGAGGTVRLPRLVGAAVAAGMIASGRRVPAPEAARHGALDAVVEGSLMPAALAFARDVAARPLPPPVSARPVEAPGSDFWEAEEAETARRARGQESPVAALRAVRAAVERPVEEAMASERELFLRLRDSDQARALRHAFFAERAVSRLPELEGVAPRTVERAAVIGAGTMGAGIATALLNAGLPVVLVEREEDALARGVGAVERTLAAGVKRGLFTEAEAGSRRERLAPMVGTGGLRGVDLAIEAVFEDMEVKRAVLRELDGALPPGAILATNTSYLDLDALAAATGRPGDVIGLHFFSPAHVMKLVEVVGGAETTPDALATGFALVRRLGKVGVLSGVCEGFIGNRILKRYRAQAELVLMQGPGPAEIDAAMRAFGMAMGPFEAQDLGGLDIAHAQREAARAAGRSAFAPVADRLCEADRHGQKTGSGWYRYEAGERTPRPAPEVERIAAEEAARHGVPRAALAAEEIRRRLIWPMIDEGARLLEEGIARRPLDIDMVEIHGFGFPRWRGGLMFHADLEGARRVREGLAALSAEGLSPPPSPLLTRIAAEEGTFAALNEVESA